MLTSTIYDVKIRYSVDDRGVAGVRRTTDEVRSLGRETGRVTGMFTRLGGVVVGAFGARAAGRALFGFNSQIETARIGIAGLLKLNLGGEFSKHTATATRMIGTFQQMAKQGIGETTDYVEMAKNITRPATVAGASIAQLTKLTEGAVIASRAFGIEADMAALDIEQALMGTLAKKDRFARALLEPMGMDTDKFNALSAADRFDTLYKAMTTPAIKEMANAYEKTFAGATSALKDNLTIAFGKVGLPLFQKLTTEVRSWNKWIDANGAKVNAFTTRLADGLVSGFGVLKDGVSFIVDHADTLMALAKAWAAVKIGSMLGAGLGGQAAAGAGSAGALMAWMKRGTAASDRIDPFTGEYSYTPATQGGRGRQAVGGFRGAADNAGLLGASLGVGYTIGNALHFDELGVKIARTLSPIDGVTQRFMDLEAASKRLDVAVTDAASRGRGLGALQPIAQKTARADIARENLNLVRDYLRADAKHGILESLAGLAPGGSAVAGGRDRAAANMQQKVAWGDIKDVGGYVQYYMLQAVEAATWDAKAKNLDAEGKVLLDSAWSKMTAQQREGIDIGYAQLQMLEYLGRTQLTPAQQAAYGAEAARADQAFMRGLLGIDENGKPKMSAKPNVNVTIQRIEVQSDDPDRYAFGLVEAFRDAVKNPSQAIRTIREG